MGRALGIGGAKEGCPKGALGGGPDGRNPDCVDDPVPCRGVGAMPTSGVVKSVRFTSMFKLGVKVGDRDFGCGSGNLAYASEGRRRSVGRGGPTSG